MSQCRPCGASITWGRTDAGKSIPVDAVSSDDGNLVVDSERVAIGSLTIPVRAAKPDDKGPRFKSHFATCPNASQHRKPRTGGAK